MVRPFLALFFLGSVAAAAISPCAAQAQSAAAKECLRLNTQPADQIPWDQHERVYKQWAEVCGQAMKTDGGDIRIKKATARAYGATGRREEEIVLLREMAAQGDAESYMDIYEMYKSFYRSHVDKPQLVKRAEAEQSLRKAAELGHPFATMMLAILLDRGSTVKRDPEEAIVWAERAIANPARSPDPIKDIRPIDVQVLLGRLLVKSSDAVRKARGIALLERVGPQGRGDALAYLAETIRAGDPVRARALLEQAARTDPGAALAPLADMLVKGEGGPKDEKRALSLLRGGSARGAQYAQAYLGQLTLEDRLVKRDVAEAVRLITPWSQWDYDTQLQLARLLAENPDIEVTYAMHMVSGLTEAIELGEPGALPTLIALKLSCNNQFRDEAGGCKLVTEAANRGDSDAARRVPECNPITAKIRGFVAYKKDDLDGAISDYGEAIKADANYADAFSIAASPGTPRRNSTAPSPITVRRSSASPLRSPISTAALPCLSSATSTARSSTTMRPSACSRNMPRLTTGAAMPGSTRAITTARLPISARRSASMPTKPTPMTIADASISIPAISPPRRPIFAASTI